MAGRIPEVTRRKLASAQVGVVRADPSLSRALSGAGRELVRRGGQQVQREQTQIKQLQAQQAQTQSALDTVTASSGIAKFNSELNVIGRDAQSQGEYDKAVQEALNRNSGDFTSDDARARFGTKAAALMTRKADSFFKRNENRKIEGVQTGLNDTVEGLSEEIDDVFSDPDIPVADKLAIFADNIDIANDTISGAKDALSPEALKAFRGESAQALTRAAVLALMESDPDGVESFLSLIDAGDILDKEEISDIRKQATGMAESKKKLRKTLTTRAQNTTGQDWAQRTAKGNPPTENEINAAIWNGTATEKDARAVRKLKASKRKVFIGDNPRTVTGLLNQYSLLAKSLIDEGVDEDGGDLEPLLMAKVSGFRQKVMESMEAGTLSLPTGKKWLNRMEPIFQGGVTSLVKRVGVEQSAFLWGTTFVELITKPEDKEIATATFMNELMDRIDKGEQKAGAQLESTDIKEIMDKLVDDFTLKLNPNAGTFKLGDIRDIGGQKFKIVAKTLAGDALYDDDLNAPISVIPRASKRPK